ncbi:hypothetical protein, partial [Cellulomonas hominis]
MSIQQPRVPAGVSAGGQFAVQARGESDAVLSPDSELALIYLGAVATGMGLRGQLLPGDGWMTRSDGWAELNATVPSGDRMRLRAHQGRDGISAFVVEIERSEDTPPHETDQTLLNESYGGAVGWPGRAHAMVRGAVLTAGMLQVAAGRFSDRSEQGVRKVRLGVNIEEPSWRSSQDEEYETTPWLTAEVDGEELTISVGEDHLLVELDGLDTNGRSALVRDLVGKDL